MKTRPGRSAAMADNGAGQPKLRSSAAPPAVSGSGQSPDRPHQSLIAARSTCLRADGYGFRDRSMTSPSMLVSASALDYRAGLTDVRGLYIVSRGLFGASFCDF